MSNDEHIGSSLGSLFEELGEKEELHLLTRKKVIAEQLRAAMERQNVSKKRLAEVMRTSRSVVYRLLDPSNTAVTLTTLAKASKALGLELQLSFKDTGTDG